MANIKVALLRYCRINVEWRRLAVTPVRRGRGWDEQIKVRAGQKILEYGEYRLRWYEGSRSLFVGVGKDLQKPQPLETTKSQHLKLSAPPLVPGSMVFCSLATKPFDLSCGYSLTG
jgi:hypothetical protein